MEKQTVEYNEQPLTYYTSNNNLLLDTRDVCKIAGIPDSKTEKGTDLGEPTCDLVTAITATQSYNEEFSEWLLEYFAGFNVDVKVRPII
jgi:hypothetical protein